MARKNPSPSDPAPKPATSKLDELRARYAQSARGKDAAKGSPPAKPKKRAPKKR